MSSILPKIESLYQVPAIHQFYATSLLKLMIERLFSMESLEIGIFQEENEEGSVIGFDDDDSENVRLELKYSNYQFIISVADNTEDFDASHFTYRIFEDSSTFRMIPDKLRDVMISVAEDGEPLSFTP